MPRFARLPRSKATRVLHGFWTICSRIWKSKIVVRFSDSWYHDDHTVDNQIRNTQNPPNGFHSLSGGFLYIKKEVCQTKRPADSAAFLTKTACWEDLSKPSDVYTATGCSSRFLSRALDCVVRLMLGSHSATNSERRALIDRISTRSAKEMFGHGSITAQLSLNLRYIY